MLLLVLFVCFAWAPVIQLSKSLLHWRKSVGLFIILYCAKTDELADDFHSKLMETDVLVCLVGLLQDQNSDVRQPSIEAVTALAKIGRLIHHFVLCEA